MQPEHSNESMSLYEAIVEQASDAIILADREGAVQVWNRGAETIFGYTAAEALGRSLDLIIPERFRRAHWEGFRNAMDSGRTKYANRVLTTRSAHKDGRKVYVDLSFAILKGPDGAVIGALAIGRDCTSRYQADSALRARVLELEKQLASASKQASGGS